VLRHRRVADCEEFGELSDRSLAIDQLAEDEKTVPISERPEEGAGIFGDSVHGMR
jgi:hypothetical protein